jgi:hypothetical protein
VNASATAAGGAGTGGKAGGAATAALEAKAVSEARANATATAGGGGAAGAANASTSAITTASGGTSIATSTAWGGATTSLAQTTGRGAGNLQSDAYATGTSGSATADSTATKGTRTITGSASAPVAGVATHAAARTTFKTSVGLDLPDLSGGSNGIQAFAYTNGRPSSTTVQAQLASSPEVAAALGSSYTVLGLGSMGANYGATSGLRTYGASARYTFDLAAPTALTLGLLDFTSYGGGFNSLTLSATLNDTTTIFSDSFSTLAAARAYFDDHAIGLGSLAAGRQTIALTYALSANGARGADFSYLVAAAGVIPTVGTASDVRMPVPEPATWLSMLVGLLTLAAARRRPAGAASAAGPAR